MPRPLREYRIPRGGEFGAGRAGGRVHHGTDYHPLDNDDGEPIYGTGPGGVVTHIGYNGDVNLGLGHNVTIAYPGGRVTIDGHMRERTLLHVGSAVDENTLVGHVGHTGNAVNASPPGSHDHHQMTINGRLVDPEAYYGPTLAGTDTGTPITEQDDIMSKDILIRNSDTGAVVFANLAAGMWVGLAKDYPELLQRQGFIEQADGTVKPNVNCPSNEFEYFHSIATRNAVAAAPAGPTAKDIAAELVNLMPTKITGTLS